MKKTITILLSTVLLFSCGVESNSTMESAKSVKIEDSLRSVISNQSSVIEKLLQEKFSLQSSINGVRSVNKPNELYGEITPITLSDYSMSEILNLIDTTLHYYSRPNDIDVSIYSCGNGPSDPNKEYCNGSYNLYIATAQPDLPPTYFLYEVGPYVALKIDSVDIEGSRLFITHDNNGKPKNETLVITLSKIKNN